MLTQEQRDTIHTLRMQGFAVVVFTPDELRDAEATAVEDRLVELGWNVIDNLATCQEG